MNFLRVGDVVEWSFAVDDETIAVCSIDQFEQVGAVTFRFGAMICDLCEELGSLTRETG